MGASYSQQSNAHAGSAPRLVSSFLSTLSLNITSPFQSIVHLPFRSSSPWGVVVLGKLAVDASEGRSGGDGNCFVAHWPCNPARGWVKRRLGKTKKTGGRDMEEQTEAV